MLFRSLILTLIGVWIDSPLLISMCAVGIIAPQMLWCLDFAGNFIGVPITGMTNYMFSSSPLFLRGLSLFHGWLPFLLIYLVWRMGYDRRALAGWTGVAIAAILVCFFLMPGPRPDAGLQPVNINYVFGPSDDAAQTWMPAWAWVMTMIVGLTSVFFIPTHFILRRWAPQVKIPRNVASS